MSLLSFEVSLPALLYLASVAADFVDAFFSGSASELVMSLLGSKRISADEVEQLRGLLDARARDKKGKEPRK